MASAVAVVLTVVGTVTGGPPAAAVDPPVVDSLVVLDPGAGQPVPVVVEAEGATSVLAQVVVGFAAPQPLVLVDDGTGGDDVAGDGRWTALFAGQPAGTLVRARAVATGPGGDTPFPEADDEALHRGVVVARPPVATDLPVIDWYIAPADHQALMTQLGSKTYRPAVLAVDGVVYDGVRVRLQGGDITQAQPKKNYRFKMAKGHDLVAPALSERPLEEFVLDAEFGDTLGIRSALAWGVVDAAGGPTVAHDKVRLERGGAFEGLYTFFEEYDEEWMEANGVEDGLLYESEDNAFLHDVGPDAIGDMWDQKEPEDAPHDALAALAAAIDGPPSAASTADLLEQVDVADLVSYYAVNAVIGNIDTFNHNIWLVQDPVSDRWSPLHWDLDLSFGLPGAPQATPIMPSIFHLAAALATDARLTEMVLRRIRTIADEVLGPDGVPAWIDPLQATVAPDHALDVAKWPRPGSATADEAALRSWVAGRLAQIGGAWAGPGGVPPARTAADRVVISEIRATGPSAGDFVELANPGSVSVDVSGWTLSGATTATLPAGAVVPAGDRIVVPVSASDLSAVARDRLVVGSLDDPLPDAGGELVLRDPDGAEEARAAWQAGAPWPVAAGGRSIERIDLAAGVPGASAWRASTAGGGTPGAPWAPPTGLADEIWADGRSVATGTPVALDIEVTNHGPSVATDVVVAGPVAGCARTLARLAVGARRTIRCSVPAATDTFGSRFLRATASPASGPAAVSRTLVVSSVLVPEVQPPAVPLREVLLDPAGGLRATWEPAPAFPARRYQVTELAPGRVRPHAGTSVLGDVDSARITPADGVPVRVSVAPQLVVTGPSSTPAPAITPRPSTTWPSASPSVWASRTLGIVLRRTPTGAEVGAWTTALAGGTPPAALIDTELARGRWAAQEAKVARLYAAFFDRPAETDGLVYWSARLAAGAQISVVAESFARSPEFRARFGSGSDAAFVDLVYRGVLGRAPGSGDVAYWVGRIQAGKTRGWVMAAFSESAEGRATLAPKTDPVVISYALTGAAWTIQPYEDAVAWLRAGGSRRTVVEAARTDAAFATL
ncbi:MAG TPA: CotH kinase family protein [Iamia sp.]